MKPCYLCKQNSIIEQLNLGQQPICNRFLIHPTDKEFTYPMAVNQCNACGMIQINNPVPAQELLPQYDWITYNEPEGHLDQLVETICNLPGITKESKICGISFKDDSTLKRLHEKGFHFAWRIDPANDLGIVDLKAGVETIQNRLTPETADRITQRRDLSDVVIVRHILEHAHDPLRFIKALQQLVTPKGYVVFEVPDCTKALEMHDYTTLWEEHTLYFTPETFRKGLSLSGFSIVHFECYPYPFENSLIAIAKSQPELKPTFLSKNALKNECHRMESYSKELSKYRKKFKKFFSEYRRDQGSIAFLGAGHLTAAFINFLEVKEWIDFVVDDHPHKKGLFMPGSRLPIQSSTALVEKNIKLCFLGLNPLNEDKVIQKNHGYLEKGGTFASIFPASKRALKI